MSTSSDLTAASNVRGADEQRSSRAIELIHFLVKEVEWIRMLSTRLCRGNRDPERVAEDVETIRELSGSVAQWMRGFLDESRGERAPTGERLEIECLVARAVRQVGRRGHAPPISAHVDENVRGFSVPGELLVAVVAVVENAIESIDGGGEVTVRVGSDQGDLFISVEDSGIGMDEATLSACRDPGFTTRLASGGQGFGLYSASRILARIRGNLHLSSKPGDGTRARLVIPTSRDATPAPPSPPANGLGLRRPIPGSRS